MWSGSDKQKSENRKMAQKVVNNCSKQNVNNNHKQIANF